MEILEPQYGARHKTNPDLFWNGYEWQEEANRNNSFDFSLSRDWGVVLFVVVMVVIGVSVLVTIK